MDIEKVRNAMEDIKNQELEIIENIRELEFNLKLEKDKLAKAQEVLLVLVAYKDNLKKNALNN